jgi:hypothetical protein
MISDGYYAAAAQPWGQNPITPGPVMPPVSPVPQSYAGQPPTGYAPGGQQGPGAAAGGTGSGGQSPYGSSPYGQPGPTTPYPNQAGPSSWPTQQGGAPQWPGGAGVTGAPGGADALSQYRLGTRKPMTNEVPEAVLVSIRFMYAGFAATCAALIAGLLVLGRYAHQATVQKNAGHVHAQSVQNQMAGTMVIAVVAALIGLVCWAVLAIASRRGRGWTRIAGTVLIGIYTIVLLLVLVNTHNDPGADYTSLLVWVFGLAAAIPLWSHRARDFFYAWRKR